MPARGNPRERRVMMQQRVQQRAVAIAVAGVHDESRGLAQHDDRCVLERDIERDVLRRGGIVRRALGCRNVDALPAGDAALRIPGDAADRDAARVDPRLQAAARMLGEQLRERLIEPHARAFVGDAKRGGGLGERCFRRRSRACMRCRSAIIRGTHEGCR